MTRDHLGSGVVWGPTGGLQEISVVRHIGKTEVGDFDVVVAVQKNILMKEGEEREKIVFRTILIG
jgi:hypothetical protein